MLWKNIDYPSSNGKPLYANTTNASSNSVINGTKANTDKYYGIVAGVSPTETLESTSAANHPAHAGWVSLKLGTGPFIGILATDASGINASGFLRITDISAHGQGTGANISYTTANAQNTLQTYSSNAQLNTFGSFTVVSGGSGYSNSAAITIGPTGTSISNGTITAVLGGRAGRFVAETLVAMGSITLDDPRDNVWFSGI